MDLIAALQIALAQLVGPSAIFYALLAIGLEPALRLRRPAQLRPDRLRAARRLRRRHHGRQLRPAAVAWRHRRYRRRSSPSDGAGPADTAAAGRLSREASIATSEILRLVFRSTSSDKITHSTNGIFDYASGFYAASPFDNGKQYLLPE